MNETISRPSVDDDHEVLVVLDEYIANMDDDAACVFRARLALSPSLLASVTKALREMAMLIAAAHVLEDEDAFECVADGVFGDAIHDNPDVRRLRTHYLENAGMADFSAGSLSDTIVSQRIDSQLATYRLLHSSSL